MPDVFLPTMFRELAGGREWVRVEGSNVREVIAALDREAPGVAAKLLNGDRLKSNLAVAIDGEVGALGLLDKVEPDSEVHFVAALAGGSSRTARISVGSRPRRCGS